MIMTDKQLDVRNPKAGNLDIKALILNKEM
jgi:hypothetical protein